MIKLTTLFWNFSDFRIKKQSRIKLVGLSLSCLMSKLCKDFLLFFYCAGQNILNKIRGRILLKTIYLPRCWLVKIKNWNDSSNSLLNYLAYLQSFKLRLPPFAIHSQSKELSFIFDVVFKFCFRLQIKSFVRKPTMIDLAHLVYLYDFKSNWLYIAKLWAGNYFKIRFQKSFLFSFIWKSSL